MIINKVEIDSVYKSAQADNKLTYKSLVIFTKIGGKRLPRATPRQLTNLTL